MLKKIKTFFKRIADHTGISWIAKKVSSGWNWLFSSKANTDPKNTSPKRPLDDKNNTLPKTLDGNQLILPKQIDRPKVCLEVIDDELLLTMINKNYKILEEKYKNPCQYDEFHAFVRCDSGDFHITGPYRSQKNIGVERKSVSITSVKKQSDEGSVLSNPLEMIGVLGLGKNKEFVKVDKINYKPLKTKKTSVLGELEFEGNNFWLNLEECINIKDYKGSLTKDSYHPKFLVYLKYNKREYCITGRSVNSPEFAKHLIVESIIEKNKDGKYIDSDKILVQDDIEYVKKMLGLENGVTEVKVDSISNQPFGVKTPTTTTQQMVNNEEVTTETEEFYDAAEELDGDFHDAEEVETKTLSIVPIKKSQDNSIVINGVIIPEGAKLKFFPELSNFLSKARGSEIRRLLCDEVVPNSLLMRLIVEEKLASNNCSC